MTPPNTRPAPLARATALLFLLAGLGQAQTNISGAVSDSTTGPLLSGVVYHTTGNLNVPAGGTLTAQPGAIVKFGPGHQFILFGALDCQGTSGSPVILTDIEDDTAGGDTNGNGPSVGAPGAWGGIELRSTSDGTSLDHTEVRFGGGGFNFGGVWCLPSTTLTNISLTNTSISDSSTDGIELNSSVGTIFVSDSSITDCGGVAIDGVQPNSLAGFTNVGVHGNGGNYVRTGVLGSGLTVDLTLGPQNTPGGALVLGTNLTVFGGSTLTLEAGTVIKPESFFSITCSGGLDVNGTPANPVVVTSFADDVYGGDTNGDGPSVGAPGDWRGIVSTSTTEGIDIDRMRVRFGGQGSWSALSLGSSVSNVVTHTMVENCADEGIDLNTLSSGLSVSDTTVTGCDEAFARVHINAVPLLTNNTAVNNNTNYLLITNTALFGDVTVRPENLVGGALVLPGTLTLFGGNRLALEAGVVVKLATNATSLDIAGTLDVNGTSDQPVVFTHITDDEWGGDTNGDGNATSPVMGAWRGLNFGTSGTPETSVVRHALVRYCGAAGFAGITCALPTTSLANIKVEHSAWKGFHVTNHQGDPLNWTAYDCLNDGMEFQTSGTFTLRHLTSAGNGGVGIELSNLFAGAVVDSISWNNAGGNYANVNAANLSYSNGDSGQAGANGNLNVDPQFEDEANGNLALAFESPCIDAGDPNSPLDPDGTRTDMGAVPFDQDGPFTYCDPKPNPLGCAMTISYTGFPSATDANPFMIEVQEAVSNKSGVFFYSYNGPRNTPFWGGTLCVKGPMRRTPAQSSGGNPPPDDCSGVFAIDFNQRIQSGIDPMLIAGATVNAQHWCRQNGGTGSIGLSNGIQFLINP